MGNTQLKKFFSIAAFFAILPFAACTNSVPDNPEPCADKVISNGFDDGKIAFDKNFAKLQAGVLEVDTYASNSLYQPILKSETLDGGDAYTISFKTKIDSPDASKKFFHILVRTGSNEDVLWENAGDNADFKEFIYKVKIPDNGKKYNFQIHVRGKLKGTIADLKIVNGRGETFYPFKKDAKKFACKIDRLPTGAKEFDVDEPRVQNQKIVNAADFGVRPDAPDFVANMNRAIAHCREIGASKLMLKKGVYNISNNGSVNFENLTDFEFDGNGSTLVYRKSSGVNFAVSNCLRAKFKNFKFDWDWERDPIASLVKVEKIEREGDSYMDLKFVDYEDFPNKKSRITILTGYDTQNKNINAEGFFTRVIELSKGKGFTRREWVAPNVLRQYYPKSALAPFDVGQNYLLAHYYYDMTGFAMSSNTHLTLENIEVLSCAGHAFTVTGTQKYCQLKNVKIGIPDGAKKRYMSCAGDHCHIAYSCGFFKMLGCDFSGGNDDCLNVHDCSIFARRPPNTDRVLRTVSARNVNEFYAGDTIELRNDDYSPTGFFSKIIKVEKVDAAKGVCDFTLADPLPEQKGDGFVLFDKRYDSRNIIIRDCNFHDTKARALLILARDVTVERCNFWNLAGMAIKIETGYTFASWSEGYGADNVVIRDCNFKNLCVRSPEGRGSRDILASSYCKTDPSRAKTRYPILSNILCEKNVFENSRGIVAEIHSSGNFIFRDNSLALSRGVNSNSDGAPMFVLADCDDIKIINNNIYGSEHAKNAGVYAEEKSTSAITVGGNKLKN